MNVQIYAVDPGFGSVKELLNCSEALYIYNMHIVTSYYYCIQTAITCYGFIQLEVLSIVFHSQCYTRLYSNK